MNCILHIETATRQCSVALANEGKLLLLKEVAEEHYTHAEKLHQFIRELLDESGIKFSDLKAVSVSKGPGSYTGLRIGVSAAKGLCYALEIPLISLSTLEILAQAVPHADGLIVPMIDARRMEVFTQIFDAGKQEKTPPYALLLDEHVFDIYPDEKIYLLGDGALKAKEVLQSDRFRHLEHLVYPSTKDMITLSYIKWQNEEWEDTAYFEPFYLKDFQLNK